MEKYLVKFVNTISRHTSRVHHVEAKTAISAFKYCMDNFYPPIKGHHAIIITESKKEIFLKIEDNIKSDFLINPIPDCSYHNEVDGCCNHNQNITPECDSICCPRLSKNLKEIINNATNK